MRGQVLSSAHFVQIQKWPGAEIEQPIPSNFSAAYRDTLDLLDKELFQLDARQIVFQSYHTARQLADDGWPYVRDRPSKPGVVLQFVAKGGKMSLPCNRFQTFEDNMRALALSLEALRKVDRFGITNRGEQYQGWKQLEGPQPTFASKEAAADYISINACGNTGLSGAIIRSTEMRVEAVRMAAAVLHPDKIETGSHEKFVLLQEAIRVLGL